MTDTELISFLVRNEASVTPVVDERGKLTAWSACCHPMLVFAVGNSFREAVEKLRKLIGPC